MSKYPNGIDDSTTLPPAFGDDANSVNATISAIEAIETELGLVPSGVYVDVRTRLDILETRINNPLAPAPNVLNPFFIGNTGVTIQAGIGDPNVVLALPPPTAGSVYLREDGYIDQGLYIYRSDGYWHSIATSVGPPSISTISFASTSNITNSSTPVRIGGRDLDMSYFPNSFNDASQNVVFKAILQVTTGAATCQIQLFDATNNIQIAGTVGSTSNSSGLVLFNSGSLVVGTSPGQIRTDMVPIYEVRLAMTSGDITSDFAICTNARLEITYT